MKISRAANYFVAVLVLGAGVSTVGAQGGDKARNETPIGAWRGESKCMVRPSGCNDEDSLYRFSSGGTSQERLRLSANKIVSGREVNIGEEDCRFDTRTRTIDCQIPNGASLHFEMFANSIEGKMTLPNGIFWRKITLHRVDEK
jgi:hypothetical protein